MLAVRSAKSQFTGRFLLTIDLVGVVLILMLAAILIREARRASRRLETSLSATKAANQSLEAAVAEGQLPLVDQQAGVRLPGGHVVFDLVEGHDHRSYLRLVELQREPGGGERTWDGDGAAR